MGSVYTFMNSPVGRLTLVARGDALAAVLWEDEDDTRITLGAVQRQDDHVVLVDVKRQLEEYFAGKRTAFDVKQDAQGTAFQMEVWAALREIPFGQTRSYADIAKRIGRPKAVRAVGAANGKNPISIITPCHRVIGKNGSLVGFASGLDNKICLLKIEGAI